VRLEGATLHRYESGQWVDRGAFAGQGGFEPDTLAQNNFGLVAGWRDPAGPGGAAGAAQAVLRDLLADTLHVVAPAGAEAVEVLRITDSGFVYGRYLGADGRWRLFRHRGGVTEHFENPQGDLLWRTGNARGEMLAVFDDEEGE